MVQDAGNRLISAFGKQTEKIIYFCAAENVSPNLAVHEIRKSFKRIRALLKFYDENPEEFSQMYGQQFSEWGRFLAPVRESFVNIQIFERLAAGDILIPERKLRATRELLLEKNRMLLERELINGNGFSVIRARIDDFEQRLDLLENNWPSVKQFYMQLTVSFSDGYQIYGQVLLEPDAKINHSLRKKLKRLWYQLDFIKFMHPRYFKLKSDQLNKITEQLGEDHDLFVFQNELKTSGYDFTSDELIILENQAEHQRELNMLKLTPRLKQFFNETPEMFNQKMDKIFKIQL
ncbi:MAG TPA: CHAD domain-containing protein [Draconibacterium sp.]|nr:CHAD domain-containing protein [Draconibacterium sp.]